MKRRQMMLLIEVVANSIRMLLDCFAKQFGETILFIYANDLSLLTPITCLLTEENAMTPDSIFCKLYICKFVLIETVNLLPNQRSFEFRVGSHLTHYTKMIPLVIRRE